MNFLRHFLRRPFQATPTNYTVVPVLRPIRVKTPTGYMYLNRPQMTKIYQTASYPAILLGALSSTVKTLKKTVMTVMLLPVAYFGFPYFYSAYLQIMNRTFFKLQSWLGIHQNFSFASELKNMVLFNTFQGSTDLTELWRVKHPTGSMRLLLSSYITDLVVQIFRNKTIEREALNFLERLFKQDQTHEAGLYLLKNVLKDPRFIDESKIFGKNLIADVVQTPECKKQFKILVLTCFQDQRVKQESVNILKYLVDQQKSKDLMAEYFKEIFLRQDMRNAMSDLFTKAAFTTLKMPINQKRFGDFVLEVIGDIQVQEGIYKSLMRPLKSRVYSTLTLGLYDGSDSKSDNEQKS